MNWMQPMVSQPYPIEKYKPNMIGQTLPMPQSNLKETRFDLSPLAAFKSAFDTGVTNFSARSKNSYQNSLQNFYRSQSPYENLNRGNYTTNQDLYGSTYMQQGGIADLDKQYQKYQDLAYVAQQEGDSEFVNEFLQPKMSKIETERKTLDDYFNEQRVQDEINQIRKSIPQYQDQQYIDPYQRTQIRHHDYNDNQSDEEPSYTSSFGIPSPKVGFNMYNRAKSLEGMGYQMGAKGQNNNIDCSGAVCKIVGAPTMTSEDLTTHGKNFRQYNGPDDLKEGTVIGFDFGPKKHDVGRKHGIDHTGVIVKNPQTNELEYKESVSGTGFRTLSLPAFLQKYPNRAKQMFVSNYLQQGGSIYNRVEPNSIDPGHKEVRFPNGLTSSTPLNTYETSNLNDPEYKSLSDFHSKNLHPIVDKLNEDILSETRFENEMFKSNPRLAESLRPIVNSVDYDPNAKYLNPLISKGIKTSINQSGYEYPSTRFKDLQNSRNLESLTSILDTIKHPSFQNDKYRTWKRDFDNSGFADKSLYYKGEENKDEGIIFAGRTPYTVDVPYPLYIEPKPNHPYNTLNSLQNPSYPNNQYSPNIIGKQVSIPGQNLPPQRDRLTSLSNPTQIGSNYKPNLVGNPINTPSPKLGLNSINSSIGQQNYKPSMVGSPVPMVSPQMPVDNSQMTPLDIYDRKGNLLRQEQMRRDDHGYIGRKKYSPRGGNNYIDVGHPIKQLGGIITDPMGQYNHPGKITNIPSNNITMQGIPYPVLGISNTGDSKLMQPNMNYKFKGKSVLEIPIFQKGGSKQGYVYDPSRMQAPPSFNGMAQTTYGITPVPDPVRQVPKVPAKQVIQPIQKQKTFVPMQPVIYPQAHSTYQEVTPVPNPFYVANEDFVLPQMSQTQFARTLSNINEKQQSRQNDFWMNPYLNYITSPNPLFNPLIKNLSRKDQILARLIQPKRKQFKFS